MAEYAKLILNKVVEEDDVKALDRHAITMTDMHTEIDRKAYEFIRTYAEDNDGQAPSYATVVSEVDGFDYVPEVSDSFRWLSGKLKDLTAKKLIVEEWFETGELETALNDLSGQEFVETWLPKRLESVRMRTRVRTSVGTDIKQDGEKYLAEYGRRKAGKSFNVWKSKFPSIGEYISGNMYVLYGKSGRGKSIIALEDAINAAKQGANVLIWSAEMGWFEVMTRALVSLSGDIGVTTTQMHGMHLTAGFDAQDLQLGKLDDQFEDLLDAFMRDINSYVDGNITIRAVDDADFTDRSIRALRSDIEETNADYVVIDPFYYMDYERNTSRTTGGDATNTSMRLRALCGHEDVVVVALTQSDETNEQVDEIGQRELELPKRDEVKKTKQLLEDAYQLIGIDTDWRQGRGLVGVMKGRSGGEGNVTEIVYAPQVGVVKSMETGEESVSQFVF